MMRHSIPQYNNSFLFLNLKREKKIHNSNIFKANDARKIHQPSKNIPGAIKYITKSVNGKLPVKIAQSVFFIYTNPYL
jgi:hypothetical protein